MFCRRPAASVALVAALAVTVARSTVHHPAAGPGPAGPPRYYVEVESGIRAVVRSTATGAVTAQVPSPGALYRLDGIAAAADNRTFFVDYSGASQIRVYTFVITGSGAVSGFAPVAGGVMNGMVGGSSLAVSPDGSQIAFDAAPQPSAGIANGASAEDIVAVDTRTGIQTPWQGIRRPGWQMTVPSLSFTRGGLLVVLAQWCKSAAEGNDSCVGTTSRSTEGRDAEIWVVNPAAGGGSLDSGRLLLTQSARYPYIAQALISPDGSTIIAMVLSGLPDASMPQQFDDLSVVRISVADGRTVDVLYHGPNGEAASSSLNTDGSGQYLILADGFGTPHHGWIYHGRFHELPPTNGDGEPMAW